METLRYVVLVNGLLAVLSVAYYVLLRRETFFGANRLLLWLIVVASFAGPLLELPDWRPQPVRDVMQRTARVIVPKVLPNPGSPQPDVTITFPNGKTYPAIKNASTSASWSWRQVLIIVYLLGIVGLLIRLVTQVLSLRRLAQRSVLEQYDDFTVVRSESITAPFSFFNQVFINPLRHTPDELEQILRHERVHVQARHSLDMLGAELVCMVLWFNPAAYLFRHLLHQTLEFSADRTVLAEGVDARAYQYNLLKVSLTPSGSVITNHFNKSQLKSRIAMLNKRQSPATHWLKYPIVVLAALTLVSAFARSPLNTLTNYLPNPVRKVDSGVAAIPEKITEPVSIQPVLMESKVGDNKPDVPEILNQQVAPLGDSATKQQPAADSVRLSPSRYMQYEGDRLYWIVTPRTTFDDLAVMKQEFAKHGYRMQVQALKYDPLNTYISDIKITIIRPTAGVSDFEETGVDGGPIRSHGGYNGLNKLKTVAAVGAYPFNTNFLQVPQGLVQIVRDEEQSLATFIHDNKLKYLIATGRKISNKYAPSSTTYNVRGLLTRPDVIKKYSIKLNADSTLDISDTYLPVFINNEPISNEALKRITIKKIDTLISSEEYGKNGQQGAVRALLFYTNDIH